MKIPKQYYIWLSVGFILMGIFEFYKKEELNWKATLSSRDKIPYGTSILYEMAKTGLWQDSLTRINQTFFEYAKEDSTDYSLVYMAPGIGFDEQSTESLLKHLNAGNTIMLVSEQMPYQLMDTLGIRKEYAYENHTVKQLKLSDSNIVFTDTLNKIKAYNNHYYFIVADSVKNVKVLGTINDKPNFIEAQFSNGTILMHLSPLVFTNYYFAHGYNYQYVNGVFSKMPDAPIVWDDFLNNGSFSSQSELRYVLSSAPMRYAFYLLTFVFVIFFSLFWRRKQELIPVINPPENASIAFLSTLTNLYLSNKNNGTIAQYVVRNLRIKTKRKYLIQWNRPTLQVKDQLMKKTGKSEVEVDKLLQQINIAKSGTNISQEQLIEINKTIEKFL
ncbi:DUF4350 domain-containing protein [Saccharicrinis aurantiacus]|uniref:DUF4350 domain-containing protein n=1 Tax=Saccharicrinis aurantiacus TaxID=1849719 RepID=UPI00094F9DE5|nr:DUF4350 domain-containing protein [Saccharicrinis aurantiacus]